MASPSATPQPGSGLQRSAPQRASRSLRILVVDDDETNRLVLEAILAHEGHRTLLAHNGEQAVDMFVKERPDLVLMDIMMPIMDGYEATRRIKQQAGNDFVPVIFLTAVNDESALAKCVECGGDDFLTKPYSRTILKAKINAMARVGQLYADLRTQTIELNGHHSRLQREHELAERVFANVVDISGLKADNLKYLLSPLSISNGDILLATRTPAAHQHIMLADFTGHGLSAAVGAIPVADIFYSMSSKGFSIPDVVTELNHKMHRKLPTGFFMAACLIEIDPLRSTVSIWNGGIPDVLILDANGELKRRMPSRHLPLGILDNDRLTTELEIFPISDGDRVYAYSDGLIEASNPTGQRYTQARLETGIAEHGDVDTLFEAIRASLDDFRDGTPQTDDITMIEVLFDQAMLQAELSPPADTNRQATQWQLSLTLGPENLKCFEPVLLLVQATLEIQELYEHRARLFTVLSELYNNALEHGVLGLNSAPKRDPESFSKYYSERKQKLEQLSTGWVKIQLDHAPQAVGGRLNIRVEDSGPGFDFQHVLEPAADMSDIQRYEGRGVQLVRSLCETVTYSGTGNCVEAVYSWK